MKTSIIKSKILRISFCAVLMLFLFSCASTSGASVAIPFEQIDHTSAIDERFNETLRIINNQRDVRRSIYNNSDILFYLDRGLVNHFAGRWEESSRDLEEAERLIEEAFTRSLTESVTSFIVNDNTRSYPGEDFEDIYINVINALNYYNKGDIEGAHVEIRRVNEKLLFMADKYERAVSKAKGAPGMENADVNVEASSFSNSALARYLSILFSRAEGNRDDMRIDWEELQRAFQLAPEIYGTMSPSLRSSIEEDLNVPRGTARLNVMAFTGLSPIKEEIREYFPSGLPAPNASFPLALPVMVSRPSGITAVEVIVNDQRFRLDLIEDMGKVATETFRSRYGLIFAKTLARAYGKTLASAGVGAATGSVLEQAGVPGAELLGFAVRGVGRLATEASERADLRTSHFLPEQAHVGGINLEPGYHTITVNFLGANGSIIASDTVHNVRVEADRLNLVHFTSFGNSRIRLAEGRGSGGQGRTQSGQGRTQGGEGRSQATPAALSTNVSTRSSSSVDVLFENGSWSPVLGNVTFDILEGGDGSFENGVYKVENPGLLSFTFENPIDASAYRRLIIEIDETQLREIGWWAGGQIVCWNETGFTPRGGEFTNFARFGFWDGSILNDSRRNNIRLIMSFRTPQQQDQGVRGLRLDPANIIGFSVRAGNGGSVTVRRVYFE